MKTGLVLEGGGMRGIYTTGVLDWLLDQKYLPVLPLQAAGAQLPHQYGIPSERRVRQREEPAENRLYVRDGFYFR